MRTSSGRECVGCPAGEGEFSDRFDRVWVLSIAHTDVVPLAELQEALKSDGVGLASVDGEAELIAGLPYGHADILAKA